MAIPTLFQRFFRWACRTDTAGTADILQDPQISRMSLCELADLPFGEVTFQAEPPAAAKTPPLARCA